MTRRPNLDDYDFTIGDDDPEDVLDRLYGTPPLTWHPPQPEDDPEEDNV